MHCKKFVFYILMLVTILCLVGCSSDSGKSDPNNTGVKYIYGDMLVQDQSLVKWEGRYNFVKGDEVTADRVYLYFTATGFKVDFYGTELKVQFYHTNKDIYYDCALDDEILPNPKAERRFCLSNSETDTVVTIVSGLTEGKHTLECIKMDEGYDGYTAVESLETDGYFYYRDQEEDNANYKFMFICASGGSGFGSLGYSLDSSKVSRTTANSSSLNAFNYLTARRYGADVEFISSSGWGVYVPKAISKVIDYCGITPENTVAAAQMTGTWDYQNYVPDVIIFNIGGNDTTQGNFVTATYQEEVVKMVEKLHAYYPKAKMIWTHTNSNAGKYATTAMSDAGILTAGYMKVVVMPKVGAGDTGENTYGASSHNSFKTHLDTEKILVEALAEWGYEPFIDDVNFADYDWLLDKK